MEVIVVGFAEVKLVVVKVVAIDVFMEGFIMVIVVAQIWVW